MEQTQVVSQVAKKPKKSFAIKLPIFRYTFKKILVSPSTWVIFAITIIILGAGWSLYPAFATSATGGKIVWNSQNVDGMALFIWKQIAFYGLIGLMLFIFIAVKAVQIFRDEIDDGTLLILVSKPISRNRIWLEKWLSFQATIIGYIFLSIFIPSLLLLIPVIAGPVYYGVLFPYMWALFGIGVLFDLIFSSIVLLISLILNSKATIAIMIGFAALTNIFAQVIDPIVVIPTEYYAASQAVVTYQNMAKSKYVDSDDITWFNTEKNAYLAGGVKAYDDMIRTLMKKVYTDIINDPNYPNTYNPVAEKAAVKQVADGKGGASFDDNDKTLAKHIFDISNAYRQWNAQSIEELMTGEKVGPRADSLNDVNYNVTFTFLGLKAIDKSTLDQINSKVKQKEIFRYFNVFYQLSYLFNGLINSKSSDYVDTLSYFTNSDPYLIKFVETTTGSGEYIPDTTVKTSKILNFPVLVTVYTLLGISLLAGSWYLFNRRDFA